MDTTTMLVATGVGALVLLLIVVGVVVLLQRRGSGRRTTGGTGSTAEPSARAGRQRGSFAPPPRAPVVRPAGPPPQTGMTSLPPQPPHWQSGMQGVAPPEMTPRTPPPPAPSISAGTRLAQEVAKLRSNGYSSVSLARRPEREEFCVQVRVARSDGENVSLHLICDHTYPAAAPQLVATVDTLDSRGEIAEQRLAVSSPVLQAWGPASSLLAVVHNIMSSLPSAVPDRSPPSAEPIFARYTDIIA